MQKIITEWVNVLFAEIRRTGPGRSRGRGAELRRPRGVLRQEVRRVRPALQRGQARPEAPAAAPQRRVRLACIFFPLPARIEKNP